MPESIAFERVASGLERGTALGRLEARGTVRLALKEAGLEPRPVTPQEMEVVLRKVLPGALRRHGVQEAGTLCAQLAAELAGLRGEPASEDARTPDAVFRRLGAEIGRR